MTSESTQGRKDTAYLRGLNDQLDRLVHCLAGILNQAACVPFGEKAYLLEAVKAFQAEIATVGQEIEAFTRRSSREK